ncbi:MAG: hypothetical protein GDA39_07755 [Hyphomonadaceae bacterium]|nr:hypothetical protein [Hyphomonadaceae bacterium]MBC6412762.1 hypothetical protein [Hyphomonadaceae bacterium]
MIKSFFPKIAGTGLVWLMLAAGQSRGGTAVNPVTLEKSTYVSEDVQICFNAVEGTYREIRACTRLLGKTGPRAALRSDIHVRRGLLYLGARRFDKAGQDFAAAAGYDDTNEFACLGKGFVALSQQDHAAALSGFDDCRMHSMTAPLAVYGRGAARELSGDLAGAKQDYGRAARMKTGWEAPLRALARLETGSKRIVSRHRPQQHGR